MALSRSAFWGRILAVAWISSFAIPVLVAIVGIIKLATTEPHSPEIGRWDYVTIENWCRGNEPFAALVREALADGSITKREYDKLVDGRRRLREEAEAEVAAGEIARIKRTLSEEKAEP